jgi:integrase
MALGRSSYTIRTYCLGVQHFLRWLGLDGVDSVDRTTIAAYVGAFAQGRDREDAPRAARTVNHRLAALAAFFTFLIDRDTSAGRGSWVGRANPVPIDDEQVTHSMLGRDLPRRNGLELRRREPRVMPRDLDPALAEQLAALPKSARDRAIVTLLLRTGQRIGDWSSEHGRHGVLGMRVADVDQRRRSVVVRLKGARDEHRVPVTDDWWPLLQEYLCQERGSISSRVDPLWVGRRQGAGRPLRYPAFEAMLRATAASIGVHATAHMFRHTVAQQLVDVAGPVVAQQVLGHANVSTTVEEYAHVDDPAMVAALTEVARRQRRSILSVIPTVTRYAFPYSPGTIAALDALSNPNGNQ